MSRYSKRQVALIAELLADKLIQVYQGEQIRVMVDGFQAAGFSQTGLKRDPVKLYQMLLVAAYDRRPYTPAAGGFEQIWGIAAGAQSIPKVFESLELFSPDQVRRLSQDAIHRRLESRPYFDCSLATDGQYVTFAFTLKDLVQLIEDGLHGELLQASTAEDVQAIYRKLTEVHGIGETIGSKLVKYILREIQVGKIPADGFPLNIVWPITNEYHVSAAIERLGIRLDNTLAPLTMAVLLGRGDPYAIDALFYLHRHRAWEIDEFCDEISEVLDAQKPKTQSISTPQAETPDVELAQKLLGVIQEIRDASRGIHSSELKGAGLEGVVTSQQIEASARWLYQEMGQLAAKGRAAEMVTFYENCLQSDRGRIIGWALEQLGRTSMESEAERFRVIFSEARKASR